MFDERAHNFEDFERAPPIGALLVAENSDPMEVRSAVNGIAVADGSPHPFHPWILAEHVDHYSPCNPGSFHCSSPLPYLSFSQNIRRPDHSQNHQSHSAGADEIANLW
jgi:hypothetical protein